MSARAAFEAMSSEADSASGGAEGESVRARVYLSLLLLSAFEGPPWLIKTPLLVDAACMQLLGKIYFTAWCCCC